MTVPGSSAETAGLLRARGWSIRLLLLASVIVLAGVIYNIWSTVGFMQHGGEALSAQSDADGVDLSERTVTFLVYGGNGPLLLPLVMILICGCFVLIHRSPQGGASAQLWTTPFGRFAGLQAEVVGVAVLVGAVALGYAGATILAFTVARPVLPVDQVRGILATILVSCAATLCLLGVLLTYWWILGAHRRVVQEA
jgi:hypothetical protein